jgi:hypothetical protein
MAGRKSLFGALRGAKKAGKKAMPFGKGKKFGPPNPGASAPAANVGGMGRAGASKPVSGFMGGPSVQKAAKGGY